MLGPTQPWRNPNSSPLTHPPWGAEEVTCGSRSDGGNTWWCFLPHQCFSELWAKAKIMAGNGERPASQNSFLVLVQSFKVPMDHFGPYSSASLWPQHPMNTLVAVVTPPTSPQDLSLLGTPDLPKCKGARHNWHQTQVLSL